MRLYSRTLIPATRIRFRARIHFSGKKIAVEINSLITPMSIQLGTMEPVEGFFREEIKEARQMDFFNRELGSRITQSVEQEQLLTVEEVKGQIAGSNLIHLDRLSKVDPIVF